VAVMALERVPADIRAEGGVSRMSDPKMIKEIMNTVTIPVMAKARIGHFVECQVRSSPSPPFASFQSLLHKQKLKKKELKTDPRSHRRRLH
jgi:imidazole glycerol phosphate synthase subunit HisF